MVPAKHLLEEKEVIDANAVTWAVQREQRVVVKQLRATFPVALP